MTIASLPDLFEHGRRSLLAVIFLAIDRVPRLGSRAAYAKQAIRDKLIDHKAFIARYGDDMPEITGWRWGQEAASVAAGSTESDNV
jgi:xylulose-5-phosphate/fructose-6-phosphate phosphoketolase